MRALYLTLTLLAIGSYAAAEEPVDPIEDLNVQVNVNRGHIMALEDAVEHQAGIDTQLLEHTVKVQKQIAGLVAEVDRLRLLVVELEADLRKLQDNPRTLQ